MSGFHKSTESRWITELPVEAPVIWQFCLSFGLEEFRVQSLQELRVAANGLLPGWLVVLGNGRRVKPFRRDFLQGSRVSFGNRAEGNQQSALRFYKSPKAVGPSFSLSCWDKFMMDTFYKSPESNQLETFKNSFKLKDLRKYPIIIIFTVNHHYY